jgi:threonine dehydrogenase-like Zn-dependent dehydrogenase
MVKFENADLLLNASKADATQKIMRATSGRDVLAVLDFVGSAKTLLPQVRGHKNAST